MSIYLFIYFLFFQISRFKPVVTVVHTAVDRTQANAVLTHLHLWFRSIKTSLCHQEQILQRKDIQTSCLFSKRSHYISCWKKKIHSNLNWYLDYHRSLSTQVTLLACCLAEGETLEFMKTFFIKCEILGFPILNSPALSTNAFNLSKPLWGLSSGFSVGLGGVRARAGGVGGAAVPPGGLFAKWPPLT